MPDKGAHFPACTRVGGRLARTQLMLEPTVIKEKLIYLFKDFRDT